MKRIVCGLLCAALLAISLMTGCESRRAEPEPDTSSQSQPEETPDDEPEDESAPEEPPAQSSEPEDEFPAPELTGEDKKMVEDDLHQFINYFGTVENYSIEGDLLDQDQKLLFCLVQTFRQKDLLGLYFEQDDSGNYLIPDSVIYDESAKLFAGLMGFSHPTSDRYDADAKAYRYKPGSEATLPNYAISDVRGAGENAVYWDVDFFAADDTSFKSPLRTTRFTFNLMRLNGMPYLQLITIETK